eukprot:13762601-Alexandrium_andersonii.AAC.1
MAQARQVGRFEEDDPRGQVSTCFARGHSPGQSTLACLCGGRHLRGIAPRRVGTRHACQAQPRL